MSVWTADSFFGEWPRALCVELPCNPESGGLLLADLTHRQIYRRGGPPGTARGQSAIRRQPTGIDFPFESNHGL